MAPSVGAAGRRRTIHIMATTILLADDHQIVRDGIRTLIESTDGLTVVGEAADGREAVSQCLELRPEVILLDVGLPGLNGVEVARQINQELPTTRIVALSMLSDSSYVRRMFQAGASAYLLKDCAFDELVRALDAVKEGKTWVSPSISGVVLQDYLKDVRPQGSEALARLTPREREVLQLLAEGRATKQIAADLFVSVKTAETHRQNLMRKLEIFNIADLTKLALREGLTQLDG